MGFKSYYARHDEDVSLTAMTVTASAEDSAYPATNLLNMNAAKPAKLTATSGRWIYEFCAPVTVVAAALIYQYLDAGLDVRIEANSSSDFSAPAFSTAIVIPAKRKDGPSYQPWTENPFVIFGSPQTYQYWSVHIVGTNSQNVALGRTFLASAIHAVDLFENEEIDETERPDNDPSQIVQPTELGVETFYTLGGPRRGLTFSLISTDDNAGSSPVQASSDFRALCQVTDGREHPFLLIPRSDFNDAWLVRPDTPTWMRAHQHGAYQVWPMSVREVSRGLPWP